MAENKAEIILTALRERARCVLLRGAAGTGKTTLVRALLPALRDMGYQIILMAPTGRAAKILSGRTGHEASTIHSAIYKVPEAPQWNEDLQVWRWIFTLNSMTPAHAVIIVDESSMVGIRKHVNEHLVFGSGSLLDDLIQWSGIRLPECSNRIIFVGDAYQLPPVGEPPGLPPALNPVDLQGLLGSAPSVVELEKVWRQGANSGILEEASRVRLALTLKTFDYFSLQPHADLQFVEEERIREVYRPGVDLDRMMILAHTNERVWIYNQMVRTLLGRGDAALVPGERLLSLRNTTIGNPADGKIFRNGDLLEMTSLQGESLELVGFYNEKEEKTVRRRMVFTFRRMFVRWTGESERGEECCWINVTPIVNEDWRKDPETAGQALYVAVRRSIEEKYKARLDALSPDSKQEFIRNCLRQSELLHAPLVTYGYALTVHKAQGGDWENVWVDCRYLGRTDNEAYFRWLYTAVTRAKKRLEVIEPPEIDMLCAALTKRLADAVPEVAFAAQSPVPPSRTQTLGEILVAGGYVLERSEPLSWMHRCFIALAATKQPCGVIDVGYNGKGAVSHVALRVPGLAESVRAEVLALKGKPIARVMGEEPSRPEPASPEVSVQPVHQATAQRLLEAAAQAGIEVLKLISLNQYQLRLMLRSDLGEGYVDWYFNGKGQVSEMGTSTVAAPVLTILRDALKGEKKHVG